MNIGSIATHPGFSRIKLFLALSRTPHGLLDMTTPALGAMLWLGEIPAPHVVLLGLLTAFAGYTAVYALNDVVDYRVDKEKIQRCGIPCSGNDLDAVYVRHPLAQGLLSLREGIAWTAAWGAVALLGAYALNPTCAKVFILGCIAEAIYCLMLKVSYLRTMVSGAVKTAGGIAAVFAVTSEPSAIFMVNLFLWLFSWEVGGQNVPNDWSDVTEDRELDAETIPVRFGVDGSASIIFHSLAVSIGLSLLLYWTTPAKLSPLYLPGALLAGVFLLLVPALALRKEKTSRSAAALFNRASYYPLTMFIIVVLSSVFR
ncbi:MAG: UbiA family prenyltransferase [Acidobacteriota bacterium]